MLTDESQDVSQRFRVPIRRHFLLGLVLVGAASVFLFDATTHQSAAQRWMEVKASQGEAFAFKALGLRTVAKSHPFFEELEAKGRKLDALEAAVISEAYEEAVCAETGTRRIGIEAPYLYSASRGVLDWDKAGHLSDELEADVVAVNALLNDIPRDGLWLGTVSTQVVPPCTGLRIAAQTLHDLTLVEVRRGDLVTAHRDLLTLLRMAQLNRPGETLVMAMIRTAISGLATDTVWEALQDEGWTDLQLRQIQEALEAVDLIAAMPRVLELERIGALMEFEHYKRDGPESMAWRFRAFGQKRPSAWTETAGFFLWRTLQSEKERLRLLESRQAILDCYRQFADGVAYRDLKPVPFPKTSAWDRLLWQSKRFAALFPMSQPLNFTRMAEVVTLNDTLRRLAIVAVALERFQLRHGHYPRSLDALSELCSSESMFDPINGQTFCYRPFPDGSRPLVYSMGFNGWDDGGDGRPDLEQGVSGLTQRDIVWARAAGSDSAFQTNVEVAAAPSEPVLRLISFRRAPLRDVVAALAHRARLSLVFDPQILPESKRPVSLTYENVTARDALQAILVAQGLTLEGHPQAPIHRVTRL